MDGPLTVLVIDDEIHIRRLVCRILERGGFRTTYVEDGWQALDILSDPESYPT